MASDWVQNSNFLWNSNWLIFSQLSTQICQLWKQKQSHPVWKWVMERVKSCIAKKETGVVSCLGIINILIELSDMLIRSSKTRPDERHIDICATDFVGLVTIFLCKKFTHKSFIFSSDCALSLWPCSQIQRWSFSDFFQVVISEVSSTSDLYLQINSVV